MFYDTNVIAVCYRFSVSLFSHETDMKAIERDMFVI